ncbi:MAG TPA: ABC transporter substrate-binding protein [Acidimicrobiales bacterium]|nr:ABC transporter substrate-binding protein [Acidimicrobiales bacterium]
MNFPTGASPRRAGGTLLALGLLLWPAPPNAIAANRPVPATGARPPAVAECQSNRAAGTIKFVSPFGYDASAGIIDVYAALKLGYFKDLCLDVDFIDAPPGTAYTLVSAGTAQVTGEGSAADAMVAEAHGANFVGVSTFGDTSDYVLLTRKSITNLKQLQGKVLGYHTVLPVVLHEMLVKAGVKLSKVILVNDTAYNPLLLVDGHYDALQAYESNEPITLRADHEPFNMWAPAQFGVSGTFNVQVVNRVFLTDHRTAAADFLRAELHAFYFCLDHASTCVGYLAKASPTSFDVAHAEQEWQIESSLAEHHHLPGKGIGVQTATEWQPEAAALLEYKLVARPVDLLDAQDTALAASLYRGTQLTWP